ncbi:MAG: amino acid permease [Acidobacteriia bacterium]|nr:amino acid permease [Terriglobia bacterium]
MSHRPHLDRGMGLLAATATNVIAMVGVGPFLVIPLMLTTMNGPHIIYAWIVGAVLAICDGLVYAQLGAALPGSGGPYLYMREAYQPFGLGRLMAFVYICQIILVAPLSVAGGAVGFSDYLQFYWTTMTPLEHKGIAAAVCIGMTLLLYRDIASVGRLAVVMMVVVLVTAGWVIAAGLGGSSVRLAFTFPPEAFRFDRDLLVKIGATSVLAMYSYGGYNQVCSIGEEIKTPERTVPRSILLSILAVALIYIVMSSAIVGLVPWREAAGTHTIASIFIERTFTDPATGHVAAIAMTALILFVAAASLYSLILGYSRVPFAAARDGDFFKLFARVHPTKHFPHVALLTIGAVSLPFCLFSLGQLVNWLMQVQILTIFVWQCAGVLLLHRFRRDLYQPFTMWLYPLPALVALVMWVYVYATGPTAGITFSIGFFLTSLLLYFMFARGGR